MSGAAARWCESSVPLTPQSVHHVAVSCDGQQTPASVQVRHVQPVLGPDGREYYLIGLEFLIDAVGAAGADRGLD